MAIKYLPRNILHTHWTGLHVAWDFAMGSSADGFDRGGGVFVFGTFDLGGDFGGDGESVGLFGLLRGGGGGDGQQGRSWGDIHCGDLAEYRKTGK